VLAGQIVSDRQPLWLYIGLPRIAVEVLLGADQQGCAIAAVGGQPARVVAASAAAEQCGVAGGQSLSSALALCGELQVLPHCPDSAARLLDELALVGYRFSPELFIDAGRGLWLELCGSEQLYRGYPQLLTQLDRALRDSRQLAEGHPLTLCSAVATTPLAAQLCAGQQPAGDSLLGCLALLERPRQRQLLEQLPIAALPLPARHHEQLAELQVDHYAALRQLGGRALGRRFGAAAVTLIEQLEHGNHPPGVTAPFRPAEQFYSSWQHSEALASKAGLLFPVKRLTQQLAQYLQARQLNSLALEWQLSNIYNQQCALSVRLSGGDHRWQQFFTLTQLQIDRATLPAQIDKVVLSCTEFSQQANGQTDLLGSALSAEHGDAQRQELLDLFHNRLGHRAVGQLASAADHLPEWRSQVVEAATNAAANSALAQPTAEPRRPLWLLEPAQPLAASLRYRGTVLQLLGAAERISEPWWQPHTPRHGALFSGYRDYFTATDQRGNHYWLYRRSSDGSWFIHGLFG